MTISPSSVNPGCNTFWFSSLILTFLPILHPPLIVAFSIKMTIFHQLNHAGIKVDLSTFSEANKTRDPQIFRHLYHKLMSKLFWLQRYRQVKWITTLNQDTKSTGHLIVSPGQTHEINFGEDIVKMLPENGVTVGDKGFCSHKVLDQFIENDALFIIRIKSHWKWDENYHITTERG